MFHRILFITAFLLVAGVTAVTGADQAAGQRSEEEIERSSASISSTTRK